ncbi:MAG: hypothetical protein H7839_22010 [Magnetococcus sp. YQC-5]
MTLLAVPAVFQGKTLAVLEVASFHAMTPVHPEPPPVQFGSGRHFTGASPGPFQSLLHMACVLVPCQNSIVGLQGWFPGGVSGL